MIWKGLPREDWGGFTVLQESLILFQGPGTEDKGKQGTKVRFSTSTLVMLANHHSKVTKQVQEADAKTAEIRINMLWFLENSFEREWGESVETLGQLWDHDSDLILLREGRKLGVSVLDSPAI